MSNTLGYAFRVTCFGESHGKVIGAVIDGCPAGLPISEREIQSYMDLRRPGTSGIYSQRMEEDRVEVLSGVFRGFTTGSPIAMVVWNRDVDSSPYEEYFRKPRPGHADYTARVKYRGFNDYRGGGRFSGRVTASFVMAGAVALKLLRYCLGVEVLAYTKEIAGVRAGALTLEEIREKRYASDVRCPDETAAEKMRARIRDAMERGDSVGGVIEAVVPSPPVGLGEPVFSSLESDLSKALFSIPAVKGVEFGSGFALSRMRGSESNDQFIVRNGGVATATNHSGGILGGISNGMPIVLRVVVKPASSIRIPQRTVDLEIMREEALRIRGRHDPCIVPRAVPVVESMVALVLADHAIRGGFVPPVIG